MLFLFSFSYALSGAGSRKQQPKQRRQDFHHPRHFLQHLWEDSEALQGQGPQPSSMSWFSLSASSQGTCLEASPGRILNATTADSSRTRPCYTAFIAIGKSGSICCLVSRQHHQSPQLFLQYNGAAHQFLWTAFLFLSVFFRVKCLECCSFFSLMSSTCVSLFLSLPTSMPALFLFLVHQFTSIFFSNLHF